ncbi:hypothetical protein [Paenibacillus naphthalenovorans]|uniref:hypothetical protein n=1 Tax=Paenibacillus naphthalenovorans TaxID=162209 RepID=UPI000889770F|nr:hypothetical protein [Paenibacillus naphthalenovorans]SDI50114.1 hypothetical protein SAMN05421868_10754 [Paenibacillus naphthalenovorans]
MADKKPITPFGWAVLRRLAELNKSRKDFCLEEGISASRFSEILRDKRRATKDRNKIEKALGLNEQLLHRKAE